MKEWVIICIVVGSVVGSVAVVVFGLKSVTIKFKGSDRAGEKLPRPRKQLKS